jgi:starch synthase
MRVSVLTREWPPEVYGGAGVHVEFLVRALRELIEVDVQCLGADRDGATAHRPDPALQRVNTALGTLSADLSIVGALDGVRPDIAHSHTWYANMAGHLAKLQYGIPHVVTAHSLEPRRPWKAEQLGGGYRISSWAECSAYAEADAIIAVSDGMRADILDCYPRLDPARLHVIRNGIDTDFYHPVDEPETLAALGIEPNKPIVVFVGRITRQKGLEHLIAAAHDIDPAAQIVLCAGAPDTPEIAETTAAAVAELAGTRGNVLWLREMLPVEKVRAILSAATVFCCPSVYEPLGIVNLEAMACETAVVASDVGGIPEVVDDGVTGSLVHYEESAPTEFRGGLARAVNALVTDPSLAVERGAAGRRRAVSEFGWESVAEQTVELYRGLAG